MDAAANNYTLLLIGLGIFTSVAIVVVLPHLLPGAMGLLYRQRRELRFRQYEYARALSDAEKARRKFESLNGRSQHVRPALLHEARETALDCRTMAGHAKDKVMVAENHLRKTIMEQYPPAVQPRMIEKYLPAREIKAMPFGF